MVTNYFQNPSLIAQDAFWELRVISFEMFSQNQFVPILLNKLENRNEKNKIQKRSYRT